MMPIPRRFAAKVISSTAKIMRLDRRYLEKIITWDQVSRSESYKHFDSAPGANSWVFRLLNSHAFLKLPTGNIEKMFQRFEEVKALPGEIIMREGDAPDYFYVIREGTASVSKYLDGCAASRRLSSRRRYLWRRCLAGQCAAQRDGSHHAGRPFDAA